MDKRAVMVEPVNPPQCEAQRHTKYAYDMSDINLPLCGRASKWVIDGKCLCQQHAAQFALAILMKEASQAEKVEGRWT